MTGRAPWFAALWRVLDDRDLCALRDDSIILLASVALVKIDRPSWFWWPLSEAWCWWAMAGVAAVGVVARTVLLVGRALGYESENSQPSKDTP